MDGLNASDLTKWTASEVANSADIDPHAVRDEGYRRHDAATKKLAKLLRQVEAAKREMELAEVIIRAAHVEMARN